MKAMLREFKTFAIRGNVIDMAVGIVIGVAFGKIVSSAVADVITPPMGLIIGDVRFVDLVVTLREAVGDKPAVVLAYGKFLQALFDFLIVAIAVFLLVRGVNSLKRKEAAKPSLPPAPSKQEVLLTEIRDLLKARSP